MNMRLIANLNVYNFEQTIGILLIMTLMSISHSHFCDPSRFHRCYDEITHPKQKSDTNNKLLITMKLHPLRYFSDL